MDAKKIGATILLGLALSLPIAAQNLNVPDRTAAAKTGADYPSRGMTMNQVQSSFGAPVRRRGAVGNPPITRWEYDGFVVYFEHKHVIHSVPKRQ